MDHPFDNHPVSSRIVRGRIKYTLDLVKDQEQGSWILASRVQILDL